MLHDNLDGGSVVPLVGLEDLQVPKPVRPNRDTVRVRQRYLHLTKADLADRLIALEQAYKELHDRWLDAQDELLALKLPKPPAH